MLFQASFDITAVDPDGKKYNKVSNVVGKESKSGIDMRMDLYTDNLVCPPAVGAAMQIALFNGKPFQDQDDEKQLAHWQFIMNGKVIRLAMHNSNVHREVVVSFGGLLLSLKGDAHRLAAILPDASVALAGRIVRS